MAMILGILGNLYMLNITQTSNGVFFAIFQAIPRIREYINIQAVWLRSYIILANVNRCYIHFLLEPVGAKAPTFSSDSKGSIFERTVNSSFALLCQAQAFPVPLMRY